MTEKDELIILLVKALAAYVEPEVYGDRRQELDKLENGRAVLERAREMGYLV